MAYSINECKSIVLGGSTPQPISEVWYCDANGTAHKVWPSNLVLGNIYVVKLSTSGINYDVVSNPYTVSGSTPSVTILPGNDYAVKATIYVKDDNNNTVETLENCYFFGETIGTIDYSTQFVHPSQSGITYGARNAKKLVSGQYQEIQSDWYQYLKWTCDTTTGTDAGCSIQGGWYATPYGYVQLGYVMDNNYTTPFVFKRATISEEVVFSKTSSAPSNSSQIWNSQVLVTPGDSLTIYPKTRKYATASGWSYGNDWESWSNIDVTVGANISYSASEFSVSISGGAYVITPLLTDNLFHDVYIGGKRIQIMMYNPQSYSLKRNGNTIDGTTISGITSSISFSIYDDLAGGYYSGNDYSFTSSNTSAFTVSGTTVTVNPNASNGDYADISGIVNGVSTNSFRVVAGTIINYYYLSNDVNNNNTVTQVSSTIYGTWNNTSSTYSAWFSIDSSFNTVRPIYFSETTYYVGSGYFSAYKGSNGEFCALMVGMPSSTSSVSVPIYKDANMTMLLCNLNITVPVAGTISISPSSVTLTPNLGSYADITVNANSSWSVTSSPSSSLFNVTYPQSNVVRITSKQNATASAVTDSITFTCGSSSTTCNITQEADYLIPSSSSFSNISTSGSTETVTVSSYGAWTATSNNSNWISVSKSGNTLYITVSSNSSTARSGSVTLTSSTTGITRTITISQNGAAATVTLSLMTSGGTSISEGGRIVVRGSAVTVNVTTNAYSWNVSTSGSDASHFSALKHPRNESFSISANPDAPSGASCTITVTAYDSSNNAVTSISFTASYMGASLNS